MAEDNNNQRPFRSNDPYSRPAAPSGNDPLAELARLIGQTDPFAEFGRDKTAGARAPDNAQHYASPPVAPDPYAVPSADHQNLYGAPKGQAPTAPPFPVGPDVYRTGFEAPHGEQGAHDAGGYDSNPYYGSPPPVGGRHAEDIYDDAAPVSRRRQLIIGGAALVALIVIGTAGAFAYRALFGLPGSSPPPVIKADNTPSKVVPPSKSEPASSKLIYDRVGNSGQGEKVVSREETPIDVNRSVAPAQASSSSDSSPTTAGYEPKKVKTISIRPDQPASAPDPTPTPASVRAAPAKPVATQRIASAPPAASATADAEEAAPPSPAKPARSAAQPSPSRERARQNPNAPLSLNPDASPAAAATAPRQPARTASAPPASEPAPAPAAGTGGGYSVQVSSQRSEADAQAAFRSLQGKFPAQLGSRQPVIRRADLGAKGVYYRAMVGPFSTSSEASELCSNLKSAGGSCIVQKN